MEPVKRFEQVLIDSNSIDKIIKEKNYQKIVEIC